MKQNTAVRSPQCHFKQWTRKKFGLFNSLNKVIKIGTLAISYVLVTTQVNSQEQVDSMYLPQEYEIDEVVISADQLPQPFEVQSRIIQTVPAQQIQSSPSQGSNAILEQLSTVDIRQRGPHDIQGDISIRGGDHNQSLILLNNIPLNNIQTGHHNLNIPLHPLFLSKIEVLQGPAGRIWGPNAFTGVAHFISLPSDSDNIALSAVYGQHNLVNSAIRLNKSFKKSQHNLGLSYRQSDGYSTNTDYNSINALYTGLYQLSKQSNLMLTLGYQHKAFGAHNYYSVRYPEQYEITERIITGAQFETGTDKLHFTSNTYFLYHADRFELFREGNNFYQKQGEYFVKGQDTATFTPSEPSLFPYRGHNYHLTNTFGNRSRLRIHTPIGQLAIGAEQKSEKVFSNVLGKPADSIAVRKSNRAFYTKQQTRATQNTSLNYLASFGKLTLSAGILSHWNSDANLTLGWYPGIDVGYNILPKLKVLASYNQSLRHPTYTELYYFDGVSKGNENLEAEKAQSYEMGLSYKSDRLQANLSGFVQQEVNSISFIWNPEESLFIAQNIAEFDRKGLAFDASYHSGIPVFETVYLNYAYMDITKNTFEIESRYTLNHLRHKLNLGLSHRIIPPLLIRWNLSYNDRLGSYFTLNEAGEEISEKYSPATLLDVYIEYELNENIKLFTRANNVTDVDYVDYGNINQPGRWISGGLVIGY